MSVTSHRASRQVQARLAHLVRAGLLLVAVGLPIGFSGAPALINAGVPLAVTAQHAHSAQLEGFRKLGNCPGDGTPC